MTDTITKCRQLGFSKYHIDVVLAIGDNLKERDVSHYITPVTLLRTLEYIVEDILEGDIQAALEAYPTAKIRLIKPSKWLPGYFLGFDHSEEMIKLGYEDAQKAEPF